MRVRKKATPPPQQVTVNVREDDYEIIVGMRKPGQPLYDVIHTMLQMLEETKKASLDV